VEIHRESFLLDKELLNFHKKEKNKMKKLEGVAENRFVEWMKQVN